MKCKLLLSFSLLCCAAASAQDTPGVVWDKNPTPDNGPVALKDEPSHRLIFQNDYVHVYDVEVYAENSTLLHRHDLPYLYVVFGPASFQNAVPGKPEVHVVLQDSDARFSPPQIHKVTADSGVDFHNITVEFTKPQNSPRNLCAKLMDGPMACPAKNMPAQEAAKKPAEKPTAKSTKASPAATKSAAADPPAADPADPPNAEHATPYFETDELRVEMVKVSGKAYGGSDYRDVAPKEPSLLIALDNASVEVDLGTQPGNFLHGGDVLWMPAGTRRAISDLLGDGSTFLLISFKNASN